MYKKLLIACAMFFGVCTAEDQQSFSFNFDDEIIDITSPSSCLGLLLSPTAYAGECHEPWEVLKNILYPTQTDLGYAYIGKLIEDHFQTFESAEAMMASVSLPVIMGPTFDTSQSVGLYLVDDHHLLAAFDFAKIKNIDVTFDILCDWRTKTYDDFWLSMQVYKVDVSRLGNNTNLPVRISIPEALPNHFSFRIEDSVFGDDSFMALAAYSKHTSNATCVDDPECMRCFYSTCEEDGSSYALMETMWGHFFQTAIESNTDLWPSVAAYTNFVDRWSDVTFPSLLNVAKVDVEAWQSAAEAVISMCRSPSPAGFVLPLDVFDRDRLPGQSLGFDPLPTNPQCAAVETCV